MESSIYSAVTHKIGVQVDRHLIHSCYLIVLPYFSDQVGQLKSKLARHVPGLKCFLDVDSLDNTADLEALVKKSKCFLLFLTKGVFASFWVMQEIRAGKQTISIYEGYKILCCLC